MVLLQLFLLIAIANISFNIVVNAKCLHSYETRFTDLSTECMLMSFENLELLDLLNVAETNQRFHALAIDVFRRKCSPFMLELIDSYRDGFSKLPLTVNVKREEIIVFNFETAVKILKNFGCTIQNLKIHNERFFPDEVTILSKHIEFMSIDLAHGFHNTDGIIEAIKSNSQIRSIELLHGFPDDFVKTINKLLPNLEILSLENFDLENTKIHFEHVKIFKIKKGKWNSPTDVTFSNLEEILVECYQPDNNGWIQFLKENQNLSRVHIESLNSDFGLLTQFEELIPEILSVEDMMISLNNRIPTDVLLKFIENHEKLKIFNYQVNDLEDDAGIIYDALADKWTIHHYYIGPQLKALRLFKKK